MWKVFGWSISLVGLIASVIGIWVYVSTEALDVVPRMSLDMCNAHGADNDRFVQMSFAGVAARATTTRIVFFQEVQFKRTTVIMPEDLGKYAPRYQCPSAPPDQVFYKKVGNGPFDYTAELMLYEQGKPFKVRDEQGGERDFPHVTVQLPAYLLPTLSVQNTLVGPAKIFTSPYIQKVKILDVEEGDASLLARIECTRKKVRYFSDDGSPTWRAIFACALPGEFLKLFD